MKEIVDVKYLYVEDIAKKLSLNEKTVRRYLKSGRLNGFKLGRRWLVSERAFRDFLHRLQE